MDWSSFAKKGTIGTSVNFSSFSCLATNAKKLELSHFYCTAGCRWWYFAFFLFSGGFWCTVAEPEIVLWLGQQLLSLQPIDGHRTSEVVLVTSLKSSRLAGELWNTCQRALSISPTFQPLSLSPSWIRMHNMQTTAFQTDHFWCILVLFALVLLEQPATSNSQLGHPLKSVGAYWD